MTIIVARMRVFARNTVTSPRRIFLVVLLLVGIFIAGASLVITAQPQAIEYSRRTIPIVGALCPGEAFEFPLVIRVEQSDAVAKVTEGWCMPGGICPDEWQSPEKKYNFVDPYALSVSITRTVPDDLPPGLWQLRHCNETRFTAGVDVTCYQVEIEIKDCGHE